MRYGNNLEVSGLAFRIHLLGNKCKSQAVEKAKGLGTTDFREKNGFLIIKAI